MPQPIPPSEWRLIFDCETTEDEVHSLRFGAFQVRSAGDLERAGFFYDARTLPTADLRGLEDYAAQHGFEVLELADFVEKVFYHYVYDLGGLCVGFNLPFDLSRIALRNVRSRRSQGFSFELSDDERRHRVRVIHRSSSYAFIQFVPRRGHKRDDHRGHFLDVKTLAKALTGSGHKLATLADTLETEHRKLEVAEHGGALDPRYVAYAMQDVQVTWECAEILLDRYARYGLSQTPPTAVASEASIGKGSLREMGARPWREVQPDFPPELIGQILSSYSGGRSEVRLRRQLAEALYCDFRSMYPTVCSLMRLWEFVIAEGMEVEDATEDTRRALEELELDDLRDPEAWEGLAVLVEVRPDGDRFPVRAQYAGAGALGDDPDKLPAQYGIAQTYLTSEDGGETLWYTKADCLASKLATGKPPKVVRAVRFRPRPPQEGLRPLDIAGNSFYRVDPYRDDLYRRLVDLRAEVQQRAAEAEASGDLVTAVRLEGEQDALKRTTNATSYGAFVELNTTDLARPEKTVVYGLDGEGFTAHVSRHEKPGRYFHPLLAALITGAARLKLCLAEALGRREGIDWALCDTDSIAFVRPDGMARDEFRRRVERVRGWFSELSPYESEGELLKLEKVNYRLVDGKLAEELEPLLCYAVSPKRYVLFNVGQDGRPVIRKASAHGLGHLLPPYSDAEAPPDIPSPAVPLERLELERWHYDLWYRMAEAALAGHPLADLSGLPGLERPAMTSYSVTTPKIAEWFERYNEGRPYQRQIRAFGFFISPIVGDDGKPLGKRDEPLNLVAPYNLRQSEWLSGEYVDIYSRESVGLSTSAPGAAVARARTYREIAERYLVHPDPRRLGPGGERCKRGTTGFLSPRHVEAFHVQQIGKEANRLEELEAGLVGDVEELYTRYGSCRRDPWRKFVVPVLAGMPRVELERKSGMKNSALAEAVAGRSMPHPGNRARLFAAAVGDATKRLRSSGLPVPRHKLGRLHAYLVHRRAQQEARTCPICGALLLQPKATYCGRACKQRAHRLRSSTNRRATRATKLRSTCL